MLLRPGNHRSDHSILPDLRHARHAKPARPGSHRGPVNLRNHHELMLDQYDRSNVEIFLPEVGVPEFSNLEIIQKPRPKLK